MHDTHSDRDVKKSMGRTLRQIGRIEKTGWKLVDDEVFGWGFKGKDNDWYDGSEDAPWSRDDDIDAWWEAIEKSDDPADVALMRRIRERRRGGKGPQGGDA